MAIEKNKQTNHKKIKRIFPLNPTQQLFLALGLFILSVLASRFGTMSAWEITVFNLVYKLPDFLLIPFLFITQFGSIYILGGLLAYFLYKRKHKIIIRLLLTGMSAYLISGFAKDIWGRTRPYKFLTDVVVRDYLVRGPGFPSGHVAMATALALSIGHYLPKKYHWIVPVWIIGVALSRLYLGVHAPLDLIGGFAIGWFCYALFRHVRLYEVSLSAPKNKTETSAEIK